VHAAFSTGPASQGSLVVVRAVRRDDEGPARVAVVAGRKLGGAVRRNRAKRRLRAAVDQRRLPDGLDFVLIARPEVVAAPFAALVTEVERVAARAAKQAAAGRT
jgi:ribonuclease P protein component